MYRTQEGCTEVQPSVRGAVRPALLVRDVARDGVLDLLIRGHRAPPEVERVPPLAQRRALRARRVEHGVGVELDLVEQGVPTAVSVLVRKQVEHRLVQCHDDERVRGRRGADPLHRGRDGRRVRAIGCDVEDAVRALSRLPLDLALRHLCAGGERHHVVVVELVGEGRGSERLLPHVLVEHEQRRSGIEIREVLPVRIHGGEVVPVVQGEPRLPAAVDGDQVHVAILLGGGELHGHELVAEHRGVHAELLRALGLLLLVGHLRQHVEVLGVVEARVVHGLEVHLNVEHRFRDRFGGAGLDDRLDRGGRGRGGGGAASGEENEKRGENDGS